LNAPDIAILRSSVRGNLVDLLGFGVIESEVGEGGSGVREVLSREIKEML
jgi:hypothetical protein